MLKTIPLVIPQTLMGAWTLQERLTRMEATMSTFCMMVIQLTQNFPPLPHPLVRFSLVWPLDFTP